VIPVGNRYLLCVSSYPLPKPFAEQCYADETARLYWMETEDFITFSKPEKLFPKGDGEDEGRMIDPFLFTDKDDPSRYLLLFKQKGISLSESYDLEHWSYLGRADGGENACILEENGAYLLLHSPHNGIGVKTTLDLLHWEDRGTVLPPETNEDWAKGRLTAAFAMKNEDPSVPYRYLVFFHGSRADTSPETHGNASLALYYTNDFQSYVF